MHKTVFYYMQRLMATAATLFTIKKQHNRIIKTASAVKKKRFQAAATNCRALGLFDKRKGLEKGIEDGRKNKVRIK